VKGILTLIDKGDNIGVTTYTAGSAGIPVNPVMSGGAAFPNNTGTDGVPYKGAITTGDGAAHTILTVPVPLGATVNVDYELVGRTTAGGTIGDSQAVKAASAWKNIAGVLTQLTTHAIGVNELQYDASVNPGAVGLVTNPISGTNLVFQVTGVVGVAIDWKMKASVSFVL
jgi:hypothetical protein